MLKFYRLSLITLVAASSICTQIAFAQVKQKANTSRGAEKSNIENEYWSRIADSTVPEDFDDYLQTFPNGEHAPLARLQAKRLRRIEAKPSTIPVTGSKPVSQKARPVIAQDPAYPVDDNVWETIATEKFFQVPSGDNVPIQLEGSWTTKTGTPVTSAFNVQRLEESNVCRVNLLSTIGTKENWRAETKSTGLTWAGLLFLNTNGQQTTKPLNTPLIINTNEHIAKIYDLIGQPFPLASGASFGFTFDTNVESKNIGGLHSYKFSCTVGSTTSASESAPGMPGTRTEVQCRSSKMNSTYATNRAYYWFSAGGCFVPDPTKGNTFE